MGISHRDMLRNLNQNERSLRHRLTDTLWRLEHQPAWRDYYSKLRAEIDADLQTVAALYDALGAEP